MTYITNRDVSLSSFSNLLPCSTSLMRTVKKSALLVLVVTTLPAAEGMGTNLIDGIITIARTVFPYITYASCMADCWRLAENPPSPWWSFEGCKRGCDVYYRNSAWY